MSINISEEGDTLNGLSHVHRSQLSCAPILLHTSGEMS